MAAANAANFYVIGTPDNPENVTQANEHAELSRQYRNAAELLFQMSLKDYKFQAAEFRPLGLDMTENEPNPS